MSYSGLLIHLCDIARPVTPDDGQPFGHLDKDTWTSIATSVRCRRVDKNQLLIKETELQQVITVQIHFLADANVIEGDRITIGTTSYTVLQVRTINDSVGPHHLVASVEEIR